MVAQLLKWLSDQAKAPVREPFNAREELVTRKFQAYLAYYREEHRRVDRWYPYERYLLAFYDECNESPFLGDTNLVKLRNFAISPNPNTFVGEQ